MSNKTPRKEKSKTKSALKPKSKSFIIVSIGMVAAVLAILIFSLNTTDDKACLKKYGAQPKCDYHLEIADSKGEREKGLSGRKSLKAGSGMLFIFEQAGRNCMWMRGMLFELDIIWLNANKNIVKIEENVSPRTYPKLFCAQLPASYVIELNSGEVKAKEYKVGSKLEF